VEYEGHTANAGRVRIQYNVWFPFMFSDKWNCCNVVSIISGTGLVKQKIKLFPCCFAAKCCWQKQDDKLQICGFSWALDFPKQNCTLNDHL
jgi:hypothetical protein